MTEYVGHLRLYHICVRVIIIMLVDYNTAQATNPSL